jgi:N-methylhydantoinase A
MALDVEAANRAIARVGEALGHSIDEAAMAIVRIANNNMIGALRSVLIERGLDPRDFTLLAFGGAGPLHAGELIVEMGIPAAIVPNNPGQFSAYGFILADARVDRQRTTQLTSKRFSAATANQVLGELVSECLADLGQQGYTDDLHVTRALEMRYLGQNYELELGVAFEAFTEQTIPQLWQAFHEAHEARFGFSIPGEIIEVVNYLATAVSVTPKPETRRIAKADGAAPREAARRSVGFSGGRHEVPIFRRQDLLAGHRIEGPALVEEPASVTVLGPRQRLSVDEYGHLLIA